MLDMKREDLATVSGVSHSALSDFEKDRRQPMPRTLAAIRLALERAGLEFLDGDQPGVRLAKVAN